MGLETYPVNISLSQMKFLTDHENTVLKEHTHTHTQKILVFETENCSVFNECKQRSRLAILVEYPF